MATRQRQFPELVEIYTEVAARTVLNVYSIDETDAAIASAVGTLSIDVSNLQTDVSDLQTAVSDLQTAVGDLETDVDNLQTDVSNAVTDITNLDISFTDKIATECAQSDKTTGSNTTANGTLKITIDGTDYFVLTAATLN